ncbi:MAG: PKD domain-containing protein [Candidatus Bipolaricaulis sp.]|nr:PKD domain-containing protein [Candidatus Bipolaricaulis sp.]
MKRGSTKVHSFRLLWLVMVGALVLTTSSCELFYQLFNQPPEAGFTVGPSTAGAAPFAITATSISSDPDDNIESYAWQFGDGGVGAGPSATHTYTTPGTWTIVLTVTDKYGKEDVATKTILVTAAEVGPVANFTATPTSGTVPLYVSFNAGASTYEDGAIQSYTWDFGDGATSYGLTTSHTYYTAGTRTVTLTVRATDGETGTATKTITASTSSGGGTTTGGTPSAQFSVAPTTGVAPLRCVFDPENSEADEGSTLIQYIWSFGDGGSAWSIDPTEQIWTYTSSVASKTYSANLTVQDNEAGVDSIVKSIKVYNHQPVAGFEIGNPPGGDGGGVVHYVAPDAPTQDNRITDDDDVDEWIADTVYYGNLAGLQTVSVVIRSRKIFDATDNWYGLTPTGTQAALKMADGTSAASSTTPSKPSGYSDHNFSYDPEGQRWTGDLPPTWFTNQAWGIRYLYVKWGDSTAEERFDFAIEDDTVMYHVYDYPGSSLPRVITVTAEDWLGFKSAAFSRTVMLKDGNEGDGEI